MSAACNFHGKQCLSTKLRKPFTTSLQSNCLTRAPSCRGIRYHPARAEGLPSQESLTQVTLKRPLGLTLAEDDQKRVFVEALVQGGNAEASGKVKTGDLVSRISAVVLKSGKEGQFEKEGYGQVIPSGKCSSYESCKLCRKTCKEKQRPYDNWDQIMFDCEGQDFDTVMSALDSNNPRWGINKVTLVLKRPPQSV